MGIGPAIGSNGDCFAAPDQLGSALTESSPASSHQIARRSIALCIPAFHGEDGKPIGKRPPHGLKRLGERAGWGRFKGGIEFQSKSQLGEPALEILSGFERGELGDVHDLDGAKGIQSGRLPFILRDQVVEFSGDGFQQGKIRVRSTWIRRVRLAVGDTSAQM